MRPSAGRVSRLSLLLLVSSTYNMEPGKTIDAKFEELHIGAGFEEEVKAEEDDTPQPLTTLSHQPLPPCMQDGKPAFASLLPCKCYVCRDCTSAAISSSKKHPGGHFHCPNCNRMTTTLSHAIVPPPAPVSIPPVPDLTHSPTTSTSSSSPSSPRTPIRITRLSTQRVSVQTKQQLPPFAFPSPPPRRALPTPIFSPSSSVAGSTQTSPRSTTTSTSKYRDIAREIEWIYDQRDPAAEPTTQVLKVRVHFSSLSNDKPFAQIHNVRALLAALDAHLSWRRRSTFPGPVRPRTCLLWYTLH